MAFHQLFPFSGGVRDALLRDPALRLPRGRPRRQRPRPLRPPQTHHGRGTRPHQLQLTGKEGFEKSLSGSHGF